MAAKWQQWMPLNINKIRGSMFFKALPDAGKVAYIFLLMAQWETEDGALSADPSELAELSGLGDKWDEFGPRIMRKFDLTEDGKVRNAVNYAEWLEAKRVFDARSQSAHRTNSRRSPNGHRDTETPVTGTQEQEQKQEQKQKPKPSRRKATSEDGMTHSKDPRHVEFKEAIHAYWKFKNGDLQMPWGGMEGAQLGMWLRDAPHITIEQFKGMLQARAKSKVNHGERPAQWIKWITSYGPGPVNEFKNTMEVGNEQGSNQNGHGAGKPSPTRERVDGARRVLANIAVKRGFIPAVGGDGAVDPTLPEPGSGIEHRTVLQGLRAVGGETFTAESREGDRSPSDQAGPVILPASR